MTLSLETVVALVTAILSIGLNFLQWQDRNRLRLEFQALRRVCDNYLAIAGKQKGERSNLHSRAEGVICSIWEATKELSR